MSKENRVEHSSVPTAPLEPILKKSPSLSAQLTEEALKATDLNNILQPTTYIGHVAISPQLRKMMEEDAKIVRGRFTFHEASKNKLKFPYKKYPGQPVETYEMMDGDIIEIPLGVAKHLNSLGVDEYDFKPDAKGNMVNTKVGKRLRCSFQSMEFVDEKDYLGKAGQG